MSVSTAPRTLILGTAGHIDHGKTALVRALTGIDTDRLIEEKERGITIDIGFAHLDVGGYQLGVVDVPGHERFVKNMLAGAAGVDVALLVVAADDSVMPQTREHLAILRMLDVAHGVIAITKSDLAEPDWLDLVETDICELVDGTFLAEAPIVRTAAPASGPPSGLDELRQALAAACDAVDQDEDIRPFRLPVDRAFTLQGRGTITTGTVWSGAAPAGDEVEWLPEGKRVKLRGLQTHGSDVDAVAAGQRAAVNLMGVHHQEIQRGHELAAPGYLKPTRLLTVQLDVLPDSPWPIKHRSRQRLYLGTQETIVKVSLLEGTALAPGEKGWAQLFCAEPTVAAGGQPFVVRAESPLVTIGGGRVAQPVAARIKRRQTDRIDRLASLLSDDEAERVGAALCFQRGAAWTELDLCRDANVAPSRVAPAIEQLEQAGLLIDLPVGPTRTLRLHADVLAEAEARVTRALERLHADSPLLAAVARPRVVARLSRLGDEAMLNALIDRMVQQGRLKADATGGAVALTSHAPKLSKEKLKLYEHVTAAFRDAALKPPDEKELAQSTGARAADVKQMIDLAVAEGQVVHLGGGLYMHTEAEARMRQLTGDALRDSDGLTMSQLRDVLGVTRKYAVPFGEYLDRIGFTKRHGDVRVLA